MTGWYPELRNAHRAHAQENQAIEAKELALSIAQIIHDKHGEKISILDVSGPLVIADYFVVASARNTRHAKAIASGVNQTMKQSGRLRRHTAGVDGDSNWVLLDFDSVVVHIFQEDARSFYDLESLWCDVPKEEFVPDSEPTEPAGDSQGTWESYPDSTSTL